MNIFLECLTKKKLYTNRKEEYLIKLNGTIINYSFLDFIQKMLSKLPMLRNKYE